MDVAVITFKCGYIYRWQQSSSCHVTCASFIHFFRNGNIFRILTFFLAFFLTNSTASRLIQSGVFPFAPFTMLLLKNRGESNGFCIMALDIYLHVQKEWYKIHQCFLQAITNAIQPLAQRPWTNCREHSNFICEILYSFDKHPTKDRNNAFIPLL